MADLPQKWRPGFLIKAQPKCTWDGRGAIQDIQKALQVTLPPELMNGAIRTSFISSKTQNGPAPRCLDKTSQSTWPWEWNTVIESIWCQTQQRFYTAISLSCTFDLQFAEEFQSEAATQLNHGMNMMWQIRSLFSDETEQTRKHLPWRRKKN